MPTHATIENWLGGQLPRLADYLDRTPEMATIIRDLAEGIQRYCQTRNLQPEELRPIIVITPDGKMVLDLMGEMWQGMPATVEEQDHDEAEATYVDLSH